VERRLLAIYLNDHLAGATAGLELARRARGSNRDTELGEFLERLTGEIEEDREAGTGPSSWAPGELRRQGA
jgi:hypothetical protein